MVATDSGCNGVQNLRFDVQRLLQVENAMRGLPPCQSRLAVPLESNRFHCTHPLMQTSNGMVTPEICKICDLWKAPLPVLPQEHVNADDLPSGGSQAPANINVLRRNATLPKPWEQFSVTLAIPHLDTPEILELSVRAWQWQQPRPFILIVDTGSHFPESDAFWRKIQSIAGVEVATLGIHSAVEHLSDRVAIAMDYAFARCPNDYLLATHVDVFPKHRGVIHGLRNLCSASFPVVGWEMSYRGEISSSRPTDLSTGIPGHACSLFHMPTMDRIGAGWSMRRAHHVFGLPRTKTLINGWPDTEVCLGRLLQQHGLSPLFLGRETNDENQETSDWVHARSSTVHANAGSGLLTRHQCAIRDAANRVRNWEAELSNDSQLCPPYLETIGCQPEMFAEKKSP
jgi:hypothetical protein